MTFQSHAPTPSQDEPIMVFIADDHRAFRASAEALLSGEPDIQVVGRADDGIQAVTGVTSLQPDVVLMDLKMPGLNGIEATRRIMGTAPRVAVLMLTMFDDDDSVFNAMRVGARGYLLKGATRIELVRAIHAVARGEAIFGPGIAQRVLSYFATDRTTPVCTFEELTMREREILDRIAAGQANPAIATELYISPKTVRNHISNIFAKLQVATRAEAIIRARDAGLGRHQG